MTNASSVPATATSTTALNKMNDSSHESSKCMFVNVAKEEENDDPGISDDYTCIMYEHIRDHADKHRYIHAYVASTSIHPYMYACMHVCLNKYKKSFWLICVVIFFK